MVRVKFTSRACLVLRYLKKGREEGGRGKGVRKKVKKRKGKEV